MKGFGKPNSGYLKIKAKPVCTNIWNRDNDIFKKRKFKVNKTILDLKTWFKFECEGISKLDII